MSELQFNKETCTLCGICVATCPFNALAITAEQVESNSACTFCQTCIEACPQGAISLSQAETVEATETAAAAGVLVFAEQAAGRLHPVSLEMLGKGLELARNTSWPVRCVLIGHGVEQAAAELLAYGADDVVVYDQPELEHFRPEPYAGAVCAAVAELSPAVLLFGATPLGRSLAPRVATRLHTGLTADCTSLDLRENGELVQTRPAFGGNVMARIVTPRHRPQVATVRHKVMAPAAKVAAPHGSLLPRQLPPELLRSGIQVVASVRPEQDLSIADADVIVAAGRGAASAQARELVAELARLLGGVVAASRPLVEQGLYQHAQQVGLSGRTVRPKLYIACGISGSVQHLAGIRSAGHIIAINKDPQAPIAGVAHATLVGDVPEVLGRLISRLHKEHAAAAGAEKNRVDDNAS